jgi:putative membrane protein
MSQNRIKLLTLAVALLFGGSLALAADKLSMGDSRFIKDTANGGLAEVELGKLAAEKAASPQVKEFGKKMEQDHSKLNKELQQLASSKNQQIPDKLEGKQKSTYDRLAKLSGEKFDREYMKTMIDDHKTDVDKFKKQADKADDADVKKFAAKALPTLQQHLELAQSTGQQVGAATQDGGLKGLVEKAQDKVKR